LLAEESEQQGNPGPDYGGDRLHMKLISVDNPEALELLLFSASVVSALVSDKQEEYLKSCENPENNMPLLEVMMFVGLLQVLVGRETYMKWAEKSLKEMSFEDFNRLNNRRKQLIVDTIQGKNYD
jgi:hypothetical protein